MGQRKRSERTTSISIGRFWNQVCPTFPSQNLAIKNKFFELFGAYQEGGRSSFYKRLCTRVSLQNAVRDKIHPETRTSCTESALSRWQELWAWILWTWVKLDYWQKEQESGRIGYVSSIAGNRMQWPKKNVTKARRWFRTAIVRAMGQQKRTKRTTSNSIGRFWMVLKGNLSHVSFWKSLRWFVFLSYSGFILPRHDCELRAKNGLRVQPIC